MRTFRRRPWPGWAGQTLAVLLLRLIAAFSNKENAVRMHGVFNGRVSGAGELRILIRPHPYLRRVFAAVDHFGSNTLSMTWITPLLWFTFAIVTLALPPLLSVTVTLPPMVLKVRVPPCTVA